MSGDNSLADRTDRNVDAARLLPLPRAAAGAIAVGLLVGIVSTWWAGLIAAVVIAAIVFFVLPRTASPGVLSVIGGAEVDEDVEPRLFNLIEGLGASAGADVARVIGIDVDGANLAVVGDPHDATLVVTRGLMSTLDRIELEAVVAEAMARIRSHDSHLATQAALWVCGPLVRHGPTTTRSRTTAAFMADRRASRLRSVMGDQRDFLADLAAVDITRYPPGLAAALDKMEQHGTTVESATWGTAHLWMANPLVPVDEATDAQAASLNELFSTHERLSHRSALMSEL